MRKEILSVPIVQPDIRVVHSDDEVVSEEGVNIEYFEQDEENDDDDDDVCFYLFMLIYYYMFVYFILVCMIGLRINKNPN